MSNLTQERLKELLHYDPNTGEFTWRVQRPGLFAGAVAGHSAKDRAYIIIGIDRRLYYAHRLAWLYMTGTLPPHTVDHKNLNRTDNRWCNLRLATRAQNNSNLPRRIDNTSGFRGVSEHPSGKWVARISRRYIGIFATAELAAEAYARESKISHGEFGRVG